MQEIYDEEQVQEALAGDRFESRKTIEIFIPEDVDALEIRPAPREQAGRAPVGSLLWGFGARIPSSSQGRDQNPRRHAEA